MMSLDACLSARRARAALRVTRKVLFHVALLAVAFVMAFPFYWMIVTSLKTAEEILVLPPTLIAEHVTFQNYADVFVKTDILLGYFNSVFIAVVSTAGGLLTCSMAAYAFAKLKFFGRDGWFSVFVATLMIPGQVTLLPLFVIFSNLNWIDTYLPLIVPSVLINTYGVFMLRQFMSGIPDSLGEAVKIDGGSYLRTYFTIMLPLTKPALVTLGLFMMIGSWNNYLGQMIYISSPSLYTVPLVITTLKDTYSTAASWGLIMAATTVSILPLSVAYLCCQRFITQGIATSGIKA